MSIRTTLVCDGCGQPIQEPGLIQTITEALADKRRKTRKKKP